jgi:tetratricopeptide (TPR) repeat protein
MRIYAKLKAMNRSIPGCCAALLILALAAVFAPLSHALEETEKGYETALTKGTFQVDTGDYGEAITNLKKALEFKPGDKTATQTLGIAYSRSGNFQSAKEYLEKALALDKTDARTRYELGVATYKLGETEAASGYFTEVAAGDVEDQLTKAAKQYLDLLRSARAPEKARAFTVNVLAGLQYDSNVILEPSTLPTTTLEEKKSDWRAVATVNASYPFFKSEAASAEAGYLFYKSLHRDLHRFDVQQHNLSLGGQVEVTDDVRAGLRYRYSYSLVGGSRYSTIHQVVPTLSFKMSSSQSGELFYARESKKFYDNTDFPQNSDRNGSNDAVGAAYKVALGRDLGASVSYAYDKDSTSASWWAYKGQKAAVGLNADLSGLKAFLGFTWYDQRYNDPFPGFSGSRHDQSQEYSLNLVRELTRRVSLVASELYVKNRSNLEPFDYNRNIVGLFVDVTL